MYNFTSKKKFKPEKKMRFEKKKKLKILLISLKYIAFGASQHIKKVFLQLYALS